MRGTSAALFSENSPDTAWLHAYLTQRRRTIELAERSRALQTETRTLLDTMREQLATSRASLGSIAARRRQYGQVMVRLARQDPSLRRFLPVVGASAPLTVEVETRAEGHVVRVSGEIDLGNVSQLRAALEPAVSDQRSVIVDLSRMT